MPLTEREKAIVEDMLRQGREERGGRTSRDAVRIVPAVRVRRWRRTIAGLVVLQAATPAALIAALAGRLP